MGKASRNRRRAAAVRARRTRSASPLWYAGTAVVVIIGALLIVMARGNNSASAHPNANDHWHAALGVYLCNEWQGDGNWAWPAATPQGSPARAGTNGIYAGLHSHGDGLIHIEPATTDEMGKHATVGQYFKFGGWKLSDKQVTFVGATKKAGDKCGSQPGEVRWEVNSVVKSGNPAGYKIQDGDEITVAFVPANFNMKKIAKPPSVKNLQNPNNSGLTATTAAGGSTTMPTVTTTAPTTASSSATTTSKP